MPPVRAAHVAARVSRRPASGGHSASRSSPCARVAGRWSAQPATIADRTTRTPASRGDSQSGSWLRSDRRSGWTSWRPPSSARSRPSSDTRGCGLRNLQWLVPTGRPCRFPRSFVDVSTQLANYRLRICLEQATQILLPLHTPREVFCKDLLEGLPRIDDERIDAQTGILLGEAGFFGR